MAVTHTRSPLSLLSLVSLLEQLTSFGAINGALEPPTPEK